MVFGSPELERRPILEHGTSRSGRWLRGRRFRFALWIALAEAVLLVFGVVPRLEALLVAGILVAFYFVVGRRLRSSTAREASWIAAVSQALVALVPVLLIFATAVALIAVAALAIVALVLLAERR